MPDRECHPSDGPAGHVAVGGRPRLSRGGTLAAAVFVAALLLAVVVRLTSWDLVFTGRGVRFVGDGDPWYHVLQAREIARGGRIRWWDPGLNSPLGAEVPWPPLMDLLVVGAASAWPGQVNDARVDEVAAWVPPALSVVTVVVGAAIGLELLGAWAAAGVALLLALSGPLVAVGILGRPDQHVLEGLLFGMMLWILVRAARPGGGSRLASSALLAVVLTAAFWTWLGSALLLLICGVAAAALHVLAPPEDREARAATIVIATGVSGAAVLLAVSVALFGSPGAITRVALGGVSAFPVILAAVTGGAAWILVGFRSREGGRRSLSRRLAEVVAASAIALLAASASPGLRDVVARGLAAAGRGNAWYATIHEFRHVFSTQFHPLSKEVRFVLAVYGLTPVLAVIGLAELPRWARENERRALAIVLVAVSLPFLALAGYMWRFDIYAAIPLAVLSAFGLAAIWRRLLGRGFAVRTSATVAALLVALAPCARALAMPVPSFVDLRALEEALAPARAAAPTLGDAVIAPWDLGHHVRYLANRPVVASPFGVEGGAGAMEDVASILVAQDERTVEEIMVRRGARWLLLPQPDMAVANARLYLEAAPPSGSSPKPSHARGEPARPELAETVAARLFYVLGTSMPGVEPVESFRLVAESATARGAMPFRLFERVPGAHVVVRGARPGAVLLARTWLRTGDRIVEWRTPRVADGEGRAAFRLPYVTGENGAVRASEFLVSEGDQARSLSLREDQVLGGREVVLDLGGPDASRGR